MSDLRVTDLLRPLSEGPVILEPLTNGHIASLRQACQADEAIWEIYPLNFGEGGFDASLEMLRSSGDFLVLSVIERETGEVVGMTSFIRPTRFGVVEIGATYIHPRVRGGPFNRAMKKAMIDHAFDCGMVKIEFRVDTRNARSMAAVQKLGAKQEGVLRQNAVTWTGYRRDTCVLGLLKDEWTG